MEVENEMLPIRFRFTPKNREHRRLIKNELDRNLGHIQPVELSFLQRLFIDSEENYRDIYLEHLERYRLEVEKIEKRGGFEYTEPIENYFERKYNSSEKWCEMPHKINQFLRNL